MSRRQSRLMKWTVSAVLILAPALVCAADQYETWITWYGGPGLKPFTICDSSAYYVNGIRNYDHGKHDQSATMECQSINEFLTAGNPAHTSCEDRDVTWFGGAGSKPWSYCPNGKYAVGFQIIDYGSHDQALYKMRCCRIAGVSTHHEDSYQDSVPWWGGSGEKTMAQCQEGSFITGVRMADWGKHDQSVQSIRCSVPVPD